MTPPWKFEWIEGHHEVFCPEFLARWQSLVDRSPETTVFAEPGLVRAWLNSRGAALGRVPAFCWASNDRGHEVLLPFSRMPVAWQNLWQRELIGVGQSNFFYHDPVGAAPLGETVLWEDFWPELNKELEGRGFEQADLSRVRAEFAPVADSSANAGPSAYLSLTGYQDLHDFLRHRPSKYASDIRRRMRRLSERGEVDLRVYQPAEREAAAEELQRMRAAYEKLWTETSRGDFFRQPGIFAFYEQLLDWGLPRGVVKFTALRLDHRPISWQIGLLHRGVLFGYTITYDRDFAHHSPGILLIAHVIALALQSGWKAMDLGYGPENYKFNWTDASRPMVRWQWRAKTYRSQLRQWARRAARPIRRAVSLARHRRGAKGVVGPA